VAISINLNPPSGPTATATGLATYTGQFAATVANAASELLTTIVNLNESTNFLEDGDLANLTYGNAMPPFRPAVPALQDVSSDSAQLNWAHLRAKIDQLAALAVPDAPDLAAVSADVPDLDATAPTITLPTAPDADVGAAPTSAPSLEEPALPDSPSLMLPAVPSFEDLNLPQPPSFAAPSFDEEAPQFLISAPTNEFDYVDPGYASSLRDPLVAKLLEDLTVGTYGIEAHVEDALWGRARDRAAQQAREEVDGILRSAAGTSFPMPTGALQAALRRARHKYQAALSEANRAISEKRADLYVEGRRFTIQQVQEYERTAIALYNSVQERALNVAKATGDYALAYFQAAVAQFNARLEAYRTAAQVFETRIRAELSKAEVFKAQIEAERLRVNFNMAKVEQYRVQLQGIQTVVDLYKSQLQAATIRMQVQQQKLDVFRTELQIFSERVRAKESEFGMYRAQLAGSLAEVDLYKSQIDAHNARLAGVRTRSQIQLDSNQTLMQEYTAQQQIYEAQLRSFAAQLDALLGEARGKTDTYRGYVEAVRAFAASLENANQTYLETQKLNLAGHTTVVESRRAEAAFNLERMKAQALLTQTVNQGVAGMLMNLLTALGGNLSSLGVTSKEEA